jgi:hypothetical protein
VAVGRGGPLFVFCCGQEEMSVWYAGSVKSDQDFGEFRVKIAGKEEREVDRFVMRKHTDSVKIV